MGSHISTCLAVVVMVNEGMPRKRSAQGLGLAKESTQYNTDCPYNSNSYTNWVPSSH